MNFPPLVDDEYVSKDKTSLSYFRNGGPIIVIQIRFVMVFLVICSFATLHEVQVNAFTMSPPQQLSSHTLLPSLLSVTKMMTTNCKSSKTNGCSQAYRHQRLQRLQQQRRSFRLHYHFFCDDTSSNHEDNHNNNNNDSIESVQNARNRFEALMQQQQQTTTIHSDGIILKTEPEPKSVKNAVVDHKNDLTTTTNAQISDEVVDSSFSSSTTSMSNVPVGMILTETSRKVRTMEIQLYKKLLFLNQNQQQQDHDDSVHSIENEIQHLWQNECFHSSTTNELRTITQQIIDYQQIMNNNNNKNSNENNNNNNQVNDNDKHVSFHSLEMKLRNMIHQYPIWCEPHYQLAILLYSKGYYRESKILAEQGLRMKPWNYHIINLLIILSIQLNEPTTAIYWSNQGLPSSKESIELRSEWLKNAIHKAQEYLEVSELNTSEYYKTIASKLSSQSTKNASTSSFISKKVDQTTKNTSTKYSSSSSFASKTTTNEGAGIQHQSNVDSQQITAAAHTTDEKSNMNFWQ